MASAHRSQPLVAREVRQRIEQGGERVWRLEDFSDLPFGAVATALSRLAGGQAVERLSKGVYYRPRPTAFGPSRPSSAVMVRLAARRKSVFPAGLTAANLLGFSTQSPARAELATSATSLPRKLIGETTLVHTRRPDAWKALSDTDAALLDLLRQRGKSSELAPEETIQRTLKLLGEGGRMRRLFGVASTEPPRVRAILGAAGQQLGESAAALKKLRASLNPLSRFDFGAFVGLSHARAWQAKEPR